MLKSLGSSGSVDDEFDRAVLLEAEAYEVAFLAGFLRGLVDGVDPPRTTVGRVRRRPRFEAMTAAMGTRRRVE